MASARSELFVTPRSKSGKASAWRRNTNWATPRPRQYQPGPKYGSARRASRNSSSPSSARPIWERTMPKSARFHWLAGFISTPRAVWCRARSNNRCSRQNCPRIVWQVLSSSASSTARCAKANARSRVSRGADRAFTHPADAALDEEANAQLEPELLHVDGLALEPESRVARSHRQRAPSRQLGDDVLGDAVGEIILLRIASHVQERQYCD